MFSVFFHAAGHGVLWSWLCDRSDQKYQDQESEGVLDRLHLQRDSQGKCWRWTTKTKASASSKSQIQQGSRFKTTFLLNNSHYFFPAYWFFCMFSEETFSFCSTVTSILFKCINFIYKNKKQKNIYFLVFQKHCSN